MRPASSPMARAVFGSLDLAFLTRWSIRPNSPNSDMGVRCGFFESNIEQSYNLIGLDCNIKAAYSLTLQCFFRISLNQYG